MTVPPTIWQMLIALLTLPVQATAEILKWVDSEGNVHFGDAPPDNRQTEEIEVAPAPSENAVREAQDRAQRLLEFERTFRGGEKDPSQQAEPKQAKKKTTSHAIDVECFTPIGDSWGGRIADTRKEVARTKLSKNELRQLRDFLRPLTKRHWRGVQRDITCINPKATPSTKSIRYDFHFRTRWESDELFGTQADLVSRDTGDDLLGRELGSRYKQFFWFLLSPEGLRFRSATTDLSFNIDQPGNDVEVLTASHKELTFFWRQGGRTRQANVISLRRLGTGFTLAQFFYTQGILSGKRYWKLDR